MDAMTAKELVEKLQKLDMGNDWSVDKMPVMVETFPTDGTGYVSVKTVSQRQHDGGPCIVLGSVALRE